MAKVMSFDNYVPCSALTMHIYDVREDVFLYKLVCLLENCVSLVAIMVHGFETSLLCQKIVILC